MPTLQPVRQIDQVGPAHVLDQVGHPAAEWNSDATTERYRRLFEEAPVAFFEVSIGEAVGEAALIGEMRVVGVNRLAAAVMDLPDADRLLEALPQLVGRPEIQAMFAEIFAQLAEGTYSGDLKVRTTTATDRPLSLLVRWVAAGERGIGHDRTLLIAVTDLTRQEDDATRLRRLLDGQERLVASVSHELRTPLAAVLGLATELRDRASDMTLEDLSDLSGIIAEQATAMSTTIDDLLALVRMQGPGLSVSAGTVDLYKEAKSVVDATASLGDRVRIIGRGVAIGDPLRVRQILRNVVTNAIRYGGPRVEMRFDTRGELAITEVVDDGEGIDPERVPAIFDAFERAHSDWGRPGSLGLGLSVARSLARLMNGDLVYRREQANTCFRLTLPAPPSALSVETIREVVYQSRAIDSFHPDQLAGLLEQCRRNNREANLTGLLLYHAGDFLQVLEGPPEEVERVFKIIRADPRHYRVNIILDRTQPRRSFSEWEMGSYSFDDQLARAEGVSDFLEGHNLPPRVDRYVRILLESFRNLQ